MDKYRSNMGHSIRSVEHLDQTGLPSHKNYSSRNGQHERSGKTQKRLWVMDGERLENTSMQDNRKHWIELRTPDQHADGTWSCRYIIFEFESTRWRCKRGRPEGSFASREEAEAAALNQAQRVVDSREPTS